MTVESPVHHGTKTELYWLQGILNFSLAFCVCNFKVKSTYKEKIIKYIQRPLMYIIYSSSYSHIHRLVVFLTSLLSTVFHVINRISLLLIYFISVIFFLLFLYHLLMLKIGDNKAICTFDTAAWNSLTIVFPNHPHTEFGATSTSWR